jgi:hypothetical protein
MTSDPFDDPRFRVDRLGRVECMLCHEPVRVDRAVVLSEGTYPDMRIHERCFDPYRGGREEQLHILYLRVVQALFDPRRPGPRR